VCKGTMYLSFPMAATRGLSVLGARAPRF
jgi:hypothetical protein